MPKHTQQDTASFNRKLISVAVASCFVADLVFANPTAPLVVHGTATIHQAGNLLQVTNSPNAIINWGSFSIQANEITRFIQQSASSAVLNRVIGQDPSAILGALQSNGRVFLINPNGILFGAGAQINVAGLVASSLNLSDADFLAGRMRFTDVPGAGSVVNQGAINTGQSGSVYLVAPDVANSGIITSPKGEVILAAGKSVELVNPASPNLRVEIVASGNEARNLGQIAADSGRIGIYAGLINHSGTLRADTVEVGKNGEILLKANKNIALESGSVISASGAPGGVHDGGTVKIVADDTLDMRRGSAVHVDGGIDGGNGGFLELSGQQQIALNGEYTGRARKEGYRHGSLLLDPLNINIGALGITTTLSLASAPGSIVVKQDGTRVYVVRPSAATLGNDFIEVIDTSTNAIIATINLGDGSNAYVTGMALSPDGSKLYAVFGNNSSSGFIKVVDTATNSVATTYGVSGTTSLFGVAVDSSNRIYTAGNVPFAATQTGNVKVIDGATGSPLGEELVGFNPLQIALNPSGSKVYVVSVTPNIVLQELATGTNVLLSSTPLATQPTHLAFSTDGATLYLAYGNRIEARSTSSLAAVADTIPIGADRLVVNGGVAYASLNGSVSVVDLSTKTARQTFAIGASGFSQGLGFNAANNSIYATPSIASQLAVIGLNSGTDTTAGGVILHTDAPSSTLNLPVSALNGAWSNVNLAATNNVSVNSPLLDSSIPTGGTLTLTAGNDVNVNAWIGEPGARFNHALTLVAGNNVNVNNSVYQGNQPLVLAADAAIPAQGITPNGSGNVNIKALSAPVTVDTLGSMTVSGQDFNILGGKNSSIMVNVGGVFDANLTGNFTLQGGTAFSGQGEITNASAVLQASAINIAAAGIITVAGGDNGGASDCCVGENGAMGGTMVASAVSDVTMTANTSISMSGSSIVIRGGDNNDASACCNGSMGGTGNGVASHSANATVTAGTTIALTAPTVLIRGGENTFASACCNGTNGAGAGTGSATLNANVSVTSGGNLTINTTNLTVRGGDGGASACCNGSSGGVGAGFVVNNTNATVAAGQDLIINATGSITIAGGDGSSASACCNGFDGNGTANVSRSSNALVSAARHVNITGAGLTVRGGDNNSASACCNGSSAGNGMATAATSSKGALIAGQDMTLTVSGPVVIRGGDFASASACCNGNSGGAGNVNVSTDVRATVAAGGTLTLNAASLLVRGGNAASASACCNGSSGGNAAVTVATNASALLQTPQNMILNVAGPVTISGGDNADASACCNGSGVASTTNVGVSIDSRATVSAGGALSLTAASLLVRGGNNAFTSACCNGSSVGNGAVTTAVNVSALLQTPQNMVLNVTGPVTISGGDNAEALACCNGSGVASTANVGVSIDSRATVSAGGALSLTASSLTVRGGDFAFGTACCNGSSGGNGVANVAINTSALLSAGPSLMVNTGAMTIRGGTSEIYASDNGGLNSAGNITHDANALVSADGNIVVTATSLTISGGVNTYANASSNANAGTAISNVNAAFTAGQAMDLGVAGPIIVAGGDNAYANAGDGGQNTATVMANALISAGTTLTMTNATSLTVRGGMQGSIYAADANGLGQNFATTQANASIWAMDFSYTGGPVSLLGGIARTRGGIGTNTAVAEASASVMGGGSKLYNISGDLMIIGGQALDSAGLPNLGGATARAILDPGALDITASGDVAITGGTITGIGSAYSMMLATGPINITVGGSTGLTMTGGSGGTGLSADPGSPITVTYTGGGTTNTVTDPLREGASIQTALFVPPPSPPPQSPSPILGEVPADLELANQVLIASVNEFGTTLETQQTALETEPIDKDEDKKEKAAMVCR